MHTEVTNKSISHSKAPDKYPDPRIVIVGAGYAGLAAADELINRFGFKNVTVLEASDRVGGRVHTFVDPNDGGVFEMGAQFIHSKDCELFRFMDSIQNVIEIDRLKSWSKHQTFEALLLKFFTDLDINNNKDALGSDAAKRISMTADEQTVSDSPIFPVISIDGARLSQGQVEQWIQLYPELEVAIEQALGLICKPKESRSRVMSCCSNASSVFELDEEMSSQLPSLAEFCEAQLMLDQLKSEVKDSVTEVFQLRNKVVPDTTKKAKLQQFKILKFALRYVEIMFQLDFSVSTWSDLSMLYYDPVHGYGKYTYMASQESTEVPAGEEFSAKSRIKSVKDEEKVNSGDVVSKKNYSDENNNHNFSGSSSTIANNNSNSGLGDCKQLTYDISGYQDQNIGENIKSKSHGSNHSMSNALTAYTKRDEHTAAAVKDITRDHDDFRTKERVSEFNFSKTNEPVLKNFNNSENYDNNNNNKQQQ